MCIICTYNYYVDTIRIITHTSAQNFHKNTITRLSIIIIVIVIIIIIYHMHTNFNPLVDSLPNTLSCSVESTTPPYSPSPRDHPP